MRTTLHFTVALLLGALCIQAQTTTATFLTPTVVNTNQSFTVQNNSSGPITSHYWNFCNGVSNNLPSGVNMGGLGSLYYPVYYRIAQDGQNYYAFVSNNGDGTLTRYNYGSSLLNSPTAVNLGNLGVLQQSIEDIYLEKENGTWYGIMIGGTSGEVIQLNFGNSLANMPTAVSFGNVGNMSYPQRIVAFKQNGNFHILTTNRNGNTITRLDFGNSISNVPQGVNLGNIGSLFTPDDMSVIFFAGNWYGFVVNEDDNTLTRLDFGNSLLNTPTGINLGNTGALDGPRGISVYLECSQVKGLIVNRYGDDLLKMTFSTGPIGNITTSSYGNLGNLSFPHSIERFRVGDTLFAMIPNVNGNNLTRIKFPPCNVASFPSSTLQNPPPMSFSQPGTYYINYIANEGLVNQSTYCRQIVVTSKTALNEGSAETTLFQVYPNPSSGKAIVQSEKNLRIALFNQFGQLLEEIDLNSTNNFRMEVTILKPGLYFLHSLDSTIDIHQKLIVVD